VTPIPRMLGPEPNRTLPPRYASADGGVTWSKAPRYATGSVDHIPAGTQLTHVGVNATTNAIGVLYPDGSEKALSTVPVPERIIRDVSGPFDGTYFMTTAVPSKQGLLYSRDGGRSWASATGPWAHGRLGDLTIAGAHDGEIFAMANLGADLQTHLFASSDHGATWRDLGWPGGRTPAYPDTDSAFLNGNDGGLTAAVPRDNGICATAAMELWCYDTATGRFEKATRMAPILVQGGVGILFGAGGTPDDPILYSSQDGVHWSRVTVTR